jgi:2-aminoadipate transaminase
MLEVDGFYSKLGKTFKPGVISEVVLAAFELMKQGKKIIALSGGSYDPKSFALDEIKTIFSEAPIEAWQEMLQYGSNLGSSDLRVELSKFMKRSGIEADADGEVLVTTGSQQALDILSRLFIDQRDIIVVGSPTYLSALSAFKQFEPELSIVPVDNEGMDTEALEAELKKLKGEGRKPKLLYTVPSFQNPTSVMLSHERRQRMVELAEEYDFLIMEDNPYGYISFEGPMPTPIKTMDDSGRVVYLSTFSKIVSPGLRIGWVAANREFVTKFSVAKGNVDICTDGLSQYVASELLRRNVVDKQIKKIIEIYRRKRDLMLEAMEAHFPEEAKWNDPGGGLFIWVEMPKEVDTSDMLMAAVKRGVTYIPGDNFFVDPSIRNYIRLNYSFPAEDDIVEGIKVLGEMLKARI